MKTVAREVGRSPSQVALNWVLNRPGVLSVIIGVRTLEQLEDNLGCLDVALDAGQLRRLEEVSTIDLGFPHAFLANPSIRGMTQGGADVELPQLYTVQVRLLRLCGGRAELVIERPTLH